MVEAEILGKRALDTVLRRYDCKIMNNLHRAEYVECLVASLLGGRWTLPWTEGWDWAPWDLRNDLGTKLEFKQSAARQRWHKAEDFVAMSPRFDIAPRTGYWMAIDKWVAVPGRAADIYVFAWHPETSEKLADHRDPRQWMFYVVRTHDLPSEQKSIGLAGIKERAPMVRAEALASAVELLLDG